VSVATIHGSNFSKVFATVTVTFSDREMEKKALGFLLGRFSGRVLKTGEHIRPCGREAR